jgi:hypothetical protein
MSARSFSYLTQFRLQLQLQQSLDPQLVTLLQGRSKQSSVPDDKQPLVPAKSADSIMEDESVVAYQVRERGTNHNNATIFDSEESKLTGVAVNVDEENIANGIEKSSEDPEGAALSAHLEEMKLAWTKPLTEEEIEKSKKIPTSFSSLPNGKMLLARSLRFDFAGKIVPPDAGTSSNGFYFPMDVPITNSAVDFVAKARLNFH